MSIPVFPVSVHVDSPYMDVPDISGEVVIQNEEFFLKYELFGKQREQDLCPVTLDNKFKVEEEAKLFLKELIRQKHLDQFVELH